MFQQQQRTTLAFSVLSGLFAALSGFLGKVTFDPGLVFVSILNVRVSAKFDSFFMQNSGAAERNTLFTLGLGTWHTLGFKYKNVPVWLGHLINKMSWLCFTLFGGHFIDEMSRVWDVLQVLLKCNENDRYISLVKYWVGPCAISRNFC